MSDIPHNVIENPQVVVRGFLESKINKIKANDLEGLSGLASLEHESHQEAEIMLYEDALTAYEKGDAKPLTSVLRSLYANDKYFVEVTHKDEEEENLLGITKEALNNCREDMKEIEMVFQALGEETPIFHSESDMDTEARLNKMRIFTNQLMLWGRDPKYRDLLLAQAEDKNWIGRLMDLLMTLAKYSESIRQLLGEMGEDITEAITGDEMVQIEEPITTVPELTDLINNQKHE